MKYIISALLALLDPLNCDINPTYCQINKNNPKLSLEYSQKLSELIDEASKKHNIPAEIYTAMLMQESTYKLSAVGCKKTCDYGISQINKLTAKRYGLSLIHI